VSPRADRALFLVEDVSEGVFGYTLNRPFVDVAMMGVIGTGLRASAFVGLLLQARWALGAH